MTECKKCLEDGVDSWQWAEFDNLGAITKGKCVHGVYYESEEPDNITIGGREFKLFVDQEVID